MCHLNFRGKICEKKVHIVHGLGKYGVLFCFVSSIMGVNLYTSFQKYLCFWLEKRGSTYTQENMVVQWAFLHLVCSSGTKVRADPQSDLAKFRISLTNIDQVSDQI